jgi:hypothetical protein
MQLRTRGINGWTVGKDGRDSCQKVFGIRVIVQEGRQVEGFREKYRFW